MKRLTFLLFLLPFLCSSQSSKKYPALLWKISGNGLKKPSYLYGTMHVSNRVAYYLSEQFFDALKSVDVVGLETNPGEWLENMENTGELEELSQIRNS
ncbi:MAG TPA: TraB/GumN family protein, partial [Mucilaginibacter sp.]